MCWCTYFSRLKCNHAPCSGKENKHHQTCSAWWSLIFLEDIRTCDEENPRITWNWILAQTWTLSCFFLVFPPIFFWKGRLPPFFSRIIVFAKGWCKREGVKPQDSCLINQLNSWLPKYWSERNWKHPCEVLSTSLKSTEQQNASLVQTQISATLLLALAN